MSEGRMKKLAIVIPAFKPMFLGESLKSIANQTNKNFKLYIGDDGSRDNLKEIVGLHTEGLDVYYQYFERNLGGKIWLATGNVV